MDYHQYVLTKKEYLIYGMFYIIITALIGYLFYGSFIPVLIFLPGIRIYFKYLRIALKGKRDKELTLQFKELINTISTLLSTGYSLENSIIESKNELISIYGNSLILNELDQMINKLMLHIPPEDIFSEFASRTDIDHIKTFSDVLSIAKRTGGDLIFIIITTSSSISSHIEIQRDIDTSLSSKKSELYIMSVMPLIIMIYISLTQPGFFEAVYFNIAGIIIMSLCLGFYGLAIFWAYKIINNVSR